MNRTRHAARPLLPVAVLIGVLASASCAREPQQPPAAAAAVTPWAPGTVYPTARAPNARGLLDRRGLVHAHSVYSHDACDGAPRDAEGRPDPVCFDDFRRGLCQTRHDFVMLTDHPDAFAQYEFPDVLLYDAGRGDLLLERDGKPVASWAACAAQPPALILAGTESDAAMPVGLEGHAAPAGERGLYGSAGAESIAKFKAVGAVTLVAHTEGWTPEKLIETPLDGFEMFNLHANTFRNGAAALELITRAESNEPGMPHPDLGLLAIIDEAPRYLETWGTVLARGAKRVTTMGTDCHRNTFKTLLADGERVDSYRRMMGWFSNHLLVRPDADGGFDDRALKEALREGRLYGAFEYLGFPSGFDFHARAGDAVHEMGEEVAISAGAELLVSLPSVQNLDPAVTAPTIVARLVRAKEGGWDEVARGEGQALRFEPSQPGAYRAEIRMVPRHLEAHLGRDARTLAREERVWIYSNAIHVVP